MTTNDVLASKLDTLLDEIRALRADMKAVQETQARHDEQIKSLQAWGKTVTGIASAVLTALGIKTFGH